jgi:DNA repair protein RadC
MTDGPPTYTVSSVTRRRQRKQPPCVRAPKDVYQLMRPRVKDADREHFFALFLNTKNGVIAVELVSIGSLNASIVHPREILKPAIAVSAASIILVHNHPTGDPTPSREDIEFTRRFAKCGDLIGIELLDHIVIGNGHFHSLKEHGSF